MSPPRHQTHPARAAAYRQATLLDARGRVLAYVDKLAVRVDRTGAGTLGLSGPSFAPGAFRRLVAGRAGPVAIASAGRTRFRVHGLVLTMHSGEQRYPDGSWLADSAIGTFRRHSVPSRGVRRRSRSSGGGARAGKPSDLAWPQ